MGKSIRYLIVFFALLNINEVMATTYYSKTSGGNWNDNTTWSTVGYGQSSNSGTYPKTGDSACVGDGYLVYVNFNPTCGVLCIGQGATGTVEFSSAGNYTLTIQNNLVVNSGAKIWYNGNNSRTHTLVEGGSIINNGDIDFYSDANDIVNITFNRATNVSVSGSGTFDLNAVTLNKSTSTTFTLDVQSTSFEAAIRDLTLTYGTYYHNNSSTYQVNPSGSSFTVNSDVIVKVSQGILHLSPNVDDVTLSGSLLMTGGIIRIGSSAGAGGIKYDKIGSFTPRLDIQGGTLDIYGGCTYKSGASSDPVYFSMTAGTVYLNTGSTGTSESVYNLNDVAGSTFIILGGTIVLSQNNITGASVNDFSVCCNNGSMSVGGGIIQFGDENTSDNTAFTFVPASTVIFPSVKITGSSLSAVSLQPANNSTDDIKLMSLYVDVNKTFDIQSAVGSTNNSRSVILASTMDGTVGLYNDGTLSLRTGTLVMQSSEAQQIGGASTSDIYNITINNDIGVQITSVIQVSGTLSLTNGQVTLVSSGAIKMLAGSSSDIGSSTSFINGAFSVEVASAADATINFPIGKDGIYKPISLVVKNSTSAQVVYSAEMINISATNLSYLVPGSLDKVSHYRYYMIGRSGAGSFVAGSVTFYYESEDGVTDETNLRVASYDGSSSWIDEGGTGTASPSGSITIGGISNLRTIYTLGNSVGGSNPLPVNWLSFDAKRSNLGANLTWATAAESGADYYLVQRSVDGFNFELVGKVDAVGNTVQISAYHFVDNYYLPSVIYYRIKQVDINGIFCFSTICTLLPISKAFDCHFYPNPIKDNKLFVEFGNRENAAVRIVMYSNLGRVCSTELYTNCGSVQNVKIPDSLMPGFYSVVCYDLNDGKIAEAGVIVE